MSFQQFNNHIDAHEHSLKTLALLSEYDTFMESIDTVLDIGCGKEGLDLEWWATRTTRDDDPVPLNIKCTGVDIVSSCKPAQKYENVTYFNHDFEEKFNVQNKYDVIWAHNVFQLCLNPIQTLGNWWEIASPGGMLALVVPHYTNFEFNKVAFAQPNYCYFNHTVTSMIYMLALNGWDCKAGFFKKKPGDPWVSAVVYKSDQRPKNPRETKWYDLIEAGLLPESAEKSIQQYGYLRQQDLVLPWLDKNLVWLGHE